MLSADPSYLFAGKQVERKQKPFRKPSEALPRWYHERQCAIFLFKALLLSLFSSGFSFDQTGNEYLGDLPPLLDGNLLIPLRNEADLRSYPTEWVHNYIVYLRTSITKMQDRLELAERVRETAVVLPHITISKKRRLNGSDN
jgi:hypothetical protein